MRTTQWPRAWEWQASAGNRKASGKATATPLPLGNVHECPHLQGLIESELESGGGFGEAGSGGGGGGGMKQAGP